MVSALLSAHRWAFDTLDALLEGTGGRETARVLAIHHSTLQWRIRELSASLGYDITSFPGVLRTQVAFLAHQVSTQSF